MILKEFFTPVVLQLILFFILIWLGFLTFFLFKALTHYRHLVSKVKKGDLKEILEEIIRKIDFQGDKLSDLEKNVGILRRQSVKHLQKIGFLRFNPFADTGGDQSFCLTLLDQEDNGIVLSSLHSRGQTRLYAKTIKKGKAGDFSLSKEEEESINKAKKGRI